MGLGKMTLSIFSRSAKCITHTRPPFSAQKLPEIIKPNELKLCPVFKSNIADSIHFSETNKAENIAKTVTSKIKPIPQGKSVIMTKDNDAIGTIHYFFYDNTMCKQYLPESWFTIKSDGSKELKPFLWLETVIIDSNKRGQGYGKEVLKQLYLESVKQGCEGRMLCHSAWNSHDFYGKCGWQIFGDIEKIIKRTTTSISKREAEIAILKQDPSKINELNETIRFLEEQKTNLEKIKKRLPYQEGTIMFNPTPENIAKLTQ